MRITPKIMSKEDVEIILEKHEKWLYGEKGGERGVIKNKDLSGLDLRNYDFDSMEITNVFFTDSDLTGSNFGSVNFRSVYFSGANLTDVNFYNSRMFYVDFYKANLTNARFYHAFLASDVKLEHAKLDGATGLPYMRCPEKGSFTAFKMIQDCESGEPYIAELFIPASAKRSSGLDSKCRADKAKVVSITTLKGEPAGVTQGRSWRDKNFIYKLGEYVTSKGFDTNRWRTCTSGIHFFMNREEAVYYLREYPVIGNIRERRFKGDGK